ncbi:lytic transglycosylase domain-containing protein [Foetidibacter luteolus]|uniref:lytic transglycosylase domain-containing protein n=1 Tax=Foetidibacter luteolus TaxID=2608880 RepID=UPI00129B5051|nr:lytic transglycosylase domain-containing protein [Foetidibacter luteolus]
MWHRLPIEKIKSSFSFALFALFVASIMSFTYEGKDYTGEKTKRNDTTASKSKSFKSLLSSYDATEASYQFQLNPKAEEFVEAYLDKNRYDLEKMKVWGKKQLELYDKILAANSLPVELKYISVVESNLKPGLVSSAGAVGAWQLMRDEAKRFGLTTGKHDQRKDIALSTRVAAKLLKELYFEFGDWLLVVAAYNCGVGRMKQSIRAAGTDDFWKLQKYLPLQTRNHVKKFIATHYLFEGGGGWTTMTAKETEEHKAAIADMMQQTDTTALAAGNTGTETITVSGRYNSVVISKNVQMDVLEFNDLNPYFDRMMAEGRKVELRLPSENMELFKSKKQQILQESVQMLMAPISLK